MSDCYRTSFIVTEQSCRHYVFKVRVDNLIPFHASLVAEEAKSTTKCPRANGYYAHEDPKLCSEFYSCINGVASKLSCQKGLAFNPDVGGCEWAARVPGCEHVARDAQVAPGSTAPALDKEDEE